MRLYDLQREGGRAPASNALPPRSSTQCRPQSRSGACWRRRRRWISGRVVNRLGLTKLKALELHQRVTQSASARVAFARGAAALESGIRPSVISATLRRDSGSVNRSPSPPISAIASIISAATLSGVPTKGIPLTSGSAAISR